MKLGGGPTAGTAFAMTIASGAVERSVSGQWKTPPSAATVSITVTRRTLQAGPEVIAFDASVSNFTLEEPASATDYDPTRHRLEYEWDFDDPGSLHRSPNLPTALRDANTAFGKSVAHFFEAASTYTVTCTVRDPATGETASNTVDVTINAVTSGFDAADINYIDPDGIYADAPVGAREFTSLQTFMNGFRTGTYSTPQLVYLRRGVTHDMAGVSLDQGAQLPSLMIMSDPATGGADAIIDHTSGNTLFAMQASIDPADTMSVVFYKVDFTGQWDSVTETGTAATAIFANGSATPQFLSVMDCTFDGMGTAVRLGTSLFFMANCYITNWQSYALFGSNFTGHWQVGNHIQRPALALSGGDDNASRPFNSAGCVRLTGGGKFVNIGFDYFNRCGWPLGRTRAYRVPASPMRLFTNGDASASNIGAVVNINGGISEGGSASIDFNIASSDPPTQINAVVERLIGVSSSHSREFVFSAFGSVTVRNCLFVRCDMPRIDSNYRVQQALQLGVPGSAGVQAMPIRYEGNTFLNLIANANEAQSDSLNPVSVDNGGGFDTVTQASNFIHSPNLDTPIVPYTNIDTTVLYTARDVGYRSRYQRLTFNTSSYGGDVVNGADLVIPLADINASLTLAAVDTTPTGAYTHILNTSTYGDDVEGIAFAFDATNVTITNGSGGTLSGNYTLNIVTDDDAFINLQTEFAQPADSVQTGIPLTGSTNTGIDTELAGWKDFYGVVRPASHSRGAIEVQ